MLSSRLLHLLFALLSIVHNMAFTLRKIQPMATRLSSSVRSAHSSHAINIMVPIADGSEEIETASIVDILVRAGAKVTVASVKEDSLLVTCAHGMKFQADKLISECTGNSYDVIVCPGGMPGAVHLRDSTVLRDMLIRQNNEKKWIGKINERTL
jgi:hypothetical protein